MQFGRAFTFVFEDPDWLKKVGIAALISLIPVVGTIAVLGWTLAITRRVIAGEPETLPDWDDFGGYIGKGFQALVVGLVYALPILLILFCGLGIAFIPAMLSGNNSNSDSLGGMMAVVMFCTYCLAGLLGLGTGVVLPAAYGKLASEGDLKAALNFREVLGLVRAAPGPYLLVLLGAFVANGFIAPLGTIACGIGVYLTMVYAMLIAAHLYGQAYKIAKENVGLVSSEIPPAM